MKTLLEHNKIFLKEARKYVNSLEGEETFAGLRCEGCNENLYYSGALMHYVGFFFKREVKCPNCGRIGIKTIKAWEIETMNKWDLEKIYKEIKI